MTKPISNLISFDRIAKLLDCMTLEQWEELNIDSFLPYEDNDEMTDEDWQIAGQEEHDRAWQQYEDAVLSVARQLFGHHRLDLIERTNKKLGTVYQVKPQSDASWIVCAEHIRQTINGVGLFHFCSVKEFLSSGPYTARSAVLEHLGWIPDYYAVYCDGTAKGRVERMIR